MIISRDGSWPQVQPFVKELLEKGKINERAAAMAEDRMRGCTIPVLAKKWKISGQRVHQILETTNRRIYFAMNEDIGCEVERMEVSARTQNAIMNMDIRTKAELIPHIQSGEALRWPNFGRKAFKECREALGI